MAETDSVLVRRLLASRLIGKQQLEQSRVLLGESADDDRLFRFLVEQGHLTAWQSAKVQAGRSDGFFLGKYKILEQLGAGGMGKVYRALDTGLARDVAVKILPKKKADAESIARFRREAEIAMKLRHPNIIRTVETGVEDDVYYLVMQYVDGLDLASRLKEQGVLPVRDAARIGADVARGLQYACDQGVIHRDIKPSNILLSRNGEALIADFGLVKQLNERDTKQDMTKTGSLMGTFDYLSPEQAEDAKRADTRSDIYSLGCTLYHCLTGQPPFDGTEVQKIVAHREKRPTPICSLNASVPGELAELIETRMLAKRRRDRFQTSSEVEAALMPFITDRSASPPRGIPVVDGQRQTVARDETAIPDRMPLHDQKEPPPAKRRAATNRSGVSVFRLEESEPSPDGIASRTLGRKTPGGRHITPEQASRRPLPIRLFVLTGLLCAALIAVAVSPFANRRPPASNEAKNGTKEEETAETVKQEDQSTVRPPDVTKKVEPTAKIVAKPEPPPPKQPQPAAAKLPRHIAARYGGHEYAWVQEEMTWSTAKEQCEQWGGHLLILETPREWASIRFWMEADPRIRLTADKQWTWIGATDRQTEQTWLWVDGSPFNPALWAPNQPNSEGSDEDYAVIWKTANGSLGIGDGAKPHDSLMSPFVCEWDRTNNALLRNSQVTDLADPPPQPTAMTGLRMQVFEGTKFDRKVAELNSELIDSDRWPSNWPSPTLRQGPFSIRWTGKLRAPAPGTYTLITQSDDGVRVRLDGKTIIDSWQAHAPKRDEARVRLSDQPHALEVDYYENYVGGWRIALLWKREGGSLEYVPTTALSPDGDTAVSSSAQGHAKGARVGSALPKTQDNNQNESSVESQKGIDNSGVVAAKRGEPGAGTKSASKSAAAPNPAQKPVSIAVSPDPSNTPKRRLGDQFEVKTRTDWVELFDGVRAAGWDANAEREFDIDNGLLRFRGSARAPTELAYFQLEIEFRIVPAQPNALLVIQSANANRMVRIENGQIHFYGKTRGEEFGRPAKSISVPVDQWNMVLIGHTFLGMSFSQATELELSQPFVGWPTPSQISLPVFSRTGPSTIVCRGNAGIEIRRIRLRVF